MFKLSARSQANLQNVHPKMIRVINRALEISDVDFMAIEGVRTLHRQHQLYGQGRTPAELRKVGVKPDLSRPELPVVTWTLRSKHFVDPRTGYGHAVDLLPAPYDWKDPRPFNQLADAMFAASIELGIPIRWGADWDRDGKPRERGETDSPHFELVDE
ncbi:peptidase M15 [Asticcacaulis sp. AC460]|uniref:M15 family metallopeptidase n=1 Tax=Asticcacaulis sp. AC460 TaxID=1282360 RepID=UPI0003C3E464|nr:M15 family metallopeptidase [Asticcacaulis sp. AC460]ESQ89981.1 peptidase M15 [Asticcacaulis sp. AC460]